MGGTLKSRRLAPAIGGALVLGLAMIAFAVPGSAPGVSATSAAAPVKLELLSASQSEILGAGRVRLRVSTDRPGTVVIRSRATLLNGAASKVAKRKRTGFAEAGSKVVGLRLKARGRTLLADCNQKALKLRARLLPADGSRGGRARLVRGLSVDNPGCGGGSTGTGSTGTGGGGGGNANVIPPATAWDGPAFPTGDFARCDFMDTAICLQPWPNDYFTTGDGSSGTGRRVNLDLASMPRNNENVPILNTELNRNDGFSPGNMLVTRVPGLDNPTAFQNTGAVPIDDPGAYDDPDQPIVVINAETGERHPVWSEIDSNPLDPHVCGPPDNAGNPCTSAEVNLLIRPLVNWEEGGRYVVALRDLKDASDQTIQPADAFRVYRDNRTTTQEPVEARRPHMEELFETLGQAGIQRSNLYLAWDFTIASEENLSERMLAIRDDAFGQLGDTDLDNGTVEGDPPDFSIDTVETFTPAQDPRIAKVISGSVTVPCYLNNVSCAPVGGSYNYSPTDLLNPDRLPTQAPGNEATADFQCRVPQAALVSGEANPARPSLYGHGLLGSHTEVDNGHIDDLLNEHNFIYCATDWAGFSTLNAANILAILQDLSLFPLLADHSQQGMLNFLFLGRALIHSGGLSADPAFQDADGDPLIDTEALYYDGNSQGGILGGGLTAVAPDLRRAVLGVPGMNYSTLLRRSVDFEPYAEGKFTDIVCDELPEPFKTACNNEIIADSPLGLYDNYPNELERPLILSLMQMLWDRGEANGYAHHMTSDPLEDTPQHQVLLHPAFGDHQVANVAAEVEARTIGASVYQPALNAGRHWEDDGVNPIFGLPPVPSFPFGGSALVYWDGGPVGFDDPFDGDADNDGSATPPNENIPPRPDEGFGADPHSYPRRDVKSRAQRAYFLDTPGALRNPCTTTNNLVSPPMPIAFETGTAIPCYANGYLGTP